LQLLLLEPVLVQGGEVKLHAMGTELVEVPVPLPGPVHKLDAEFESGLRAPHELELVEPHDTVERFDGGNRGFAHAHGADFVRFDQRDRASPIQGIGQ